MKNADTEVLTQLTRWLQQGQSCWLATVVKTWGSSPRPVGSLLACNNQGQVAGSLSGGCIEEDLLEKLARGELASARPELMVYGADREESERLGLPCGGQLHIVLEPLSAGHHLHDFQQILQRMQQRLWMERHLDLGSGKMTITPRDSCPQPGLSFQPGADASPETGTLMHAYGPRCLMLITGAGQVSAYLAEMAQKLDYQVLVCDPRQELLDQWPVEGVQLLSDMPDDAVRKYAGDDNSVILALTHDPRFDDMALMEALKTRAFFVGAIGSTRTAAKRRERLLQLDLTRAEIARLHAPVGLPVGSRTPAEIAVAILAQLTCLRSGKPDVIQADFRAKPD